MSNNVALLFNNSGGVDKGVSSQVGVGHWLVDGGDNWGKLSNTGSVEVGVVVVWVVSVVVSWGVQKAGVSFSVTLGKAVIPQSLDGASLSGDAIVGAVWADLGNSNGCSVGSESVVSISVRSVSVGSVRSSDEELGIGFRFSFSLVQTVDVCVTAGEVVSVSVGDGGADPPCRGVG